MKKISQSARNFPHDVIKLSHRERGKDMANGVYFKGKRKGEFFKTHDDLWVLDIDKSVKVSEHHNVFKSRQAMEDYISWLSDGKYQISPGL